MVKYDTVVIGAGNGGLACANVLAKNGQRVLVLEQSHRPGGFAGSFRRGRFEFEVSLHELCGFGRYDKPFGSVRSFFDYLGISDKIAWADVPEAFRMINLNPGKELDVTMPFGIDEFCRKAEEYAPGSEKGMRKLFALGEECRLTVEKIGKPIPTVAKLYALMKKGGFIHTAAYSVDEVLSRIDMPQKAKDIFKAYWIYLDIDTETVSFFHYMSMLNSYIELKSAIPVCRSQELINCLVECLESNSGELWLNSKVVKIDIADGICKKVILADGTQIEADNIVCNCSPHIVYGNLIDKNSAPEIELKKANARKFNGRGFVVFLGLNKSAKELGLDSYSYFIYPDMDTKKQHSLMSRTETNDVQAAICLNAANPEASPEGTCILSMTTLFNSDCWSEVTAEEYFSKKEEFASHMIDVFEKATNIRIRDYIEELDIASPESFARFTGTPQGTIYGYHSQDWDGALQRAMSLAAEAEKGIKNLYFASGWGEKLLGYSSALTAGRDCAVRILRKQEK